MLNFLQILLFLPTVGLFSYLIGAHYSLLNKLEFYEKKIDNLKTELHYLNYKYTELFKLSKYSAIELEQLFITSEFIKEQQQLREQENGYWEDIK